MFEVTRLEQQMKFMVEVDKLKRITRQTYLADKSRKENDAEHSWHLAMMCFLLAEHSNEEIDVLRTIQMVLIHDLVEIDAGDTYAYDTEGNKTKREREEKAATRIFGLLPEDQALYLRELWEEFEVGETREAKFANSLDKVQPMMLNDASDGLAWREHEVHLDQILARNKRTKEGSKALWEYSEEMLERNVLAHNIQKEGMSK